MARIIAMVAGTAMALAWPASVAAEPDAEADEKATLEEVDDELIEEARKADPRVPENPAIELVGGADLDVLRPATLKEIGAELRGFYKDGKIVPELALEFSPYAVSVGHESTYQQYRKDSWRRLARRFAVSLATTSVGEDDDSTTIAAVGARWVIYDPSDWRLDTRLLGCVEAPEPDPEPQSTLVNPVEQEASATETDEEPTDKEIECLKKLEAPWNKSQVAVGGGMSSGFPDGKLEKDLRDAAVWVAGSRAVCPFGHATLGAKYLFADTRIEDGDRVAAKHVAGLNAKLEMRSTRFGFIAGLAVGGRDEVGSFAPMDVGWELIGAVSGEVQLQLSSGTWISLRMSADLVPGDDQVLSFANYKWGYDTSPERSK